MISVRRVYVHVIQHTPVSKGSQPWVGTQTMLTWSGAKMSPRHLLR